MALSNDSRIFSGDHNYADTEISDVILDCPVADNGMEVSTLDRIVTENHSLADVGFTEVIDYLEKEKGLSEEGDLMDESCGIENSLSGGCGSELRVKYEVEECADINDNEETSPQCLSEIEAFSQELSKSEFKEVIKEDDYEIQDKLVAQTYAAPHESFSDLSEDSELDEIIHEYYPKLKKLGGHRPMATDKKRRRLQHTKYKSKAKTKTDEDSDDSDLDELIQEYYPEARRVVQATNKKNRCKQIPGNVERNETGHQADVSDSSNTCSLCGKTLSSLRCLQQHVEHEHINIRINGCSFCLSTFKTESHLKQHILAVHSSHSCTFCLDTFNTESDLKQHIVAAHGYILQFLEKCYSSVDGQKLHSQQESNFAGGLIMSGESSISQQYYNNTGRQNADNQMNLKKWSRKLNLKEKLRNCWVVLGTIDINSILRSGVYITTYTQRCIPASSWAKRSTEVKSTMEGLRYRSAVEITKRKPLVQGAKYRSEPQIAKRKPLKAVTVKDSSNPSLDVESIDQNKDYEDLPFHCDFCSYSAKYNSSLQIHVRTVHFKQYNDYKCQYCELTFMKKSTFNEHLSSEHGVKCYSCPSCSERFATNKERDEHWMSTHTDEKPYACDLCDYKTSRYTSLTLHKRTAHIGVKRKRLSCTQCVYKCNSPADLKRHVRGVHDKERPHLCPHCGKSYGYICQLRGHLNSVHKSFKPFACTECSFKSSFRRSLMVHVRSVHRKERPYSCLLCSKKFSQPANVRLHVSRVHNGVKPFHCQLCDKRFSQKGSFKSHMNINHNAADTDALFTRISDLE